MSQTATMPRGLSAGMRPDWGEFEARWDMPPSLSDNHGNATSLLAGWLGTYRAYTPCVRAT